MADLLVILLIAGFFALCVGLVRGCDRIIGSDEAEDVAPLAEVIEDEHDVEAVGVAR